MGFEPTINPCKGLALTYLATEPLIGGQQVINLLPLSGKLERISIISPLASRACNSSYLIS